MDDLISRQEAIDMIEKYFDGLPIAVHHDMLAMIHRLPSAQPKIIWCKDCKKFRRWIDADITFCDCTESEVKEGDFCSRAERRTNDSISD